MSTFPSWPRCYCPSMFTLYCSSLMVISRAATGTVDALLQDRRAEREQTSPSTCLLEVVPSFIQQEAELFGVRSQSRTRTRKLALDQVPADSAVNCSFVSDRALPM